MTDLDRQLGGLQPSDLVIVAGRPGMGKTALATNIAFNIAKAYQFEVKPDGTHATTNGGIVGFFSLEMSAEQLATRIIAEQSGVASYRIRRGDISDDDFHLITDAARADADRAVLHRPDRRHLDRAADRPGPAPEAPARPRPAGRRLPAAAVGLEDRADNRVQELTEITTGLKALAKELAVPVVALSQLSRQVESREDKRPQLSDLRESGSIEQDADVVMFVFREEYYLKNKQPREGTEEFTAWLSDIERAHGKAEVIIGKQRHGPTGTVELQFDAEVTRFSNLAREDALPERLCDHRRTRGLGVGPPDRGCARGSDNRPRRLGGQWRQLAARAAPAECAAAVKADAYGLRHRAVVPALAGAGCRTFFTAHVSEGATGPVGACARRACEGRIFVLNGFHPQAAPLPDYRRVRPRRR